MITGPFLLYIGHSDDFVGIKTARGLATFRPQDCVGEFRYDDCPLTLGLPRIGMVDAAAEGARVMVIGTANAGGVMGDEILDDARTALEAGMSG